MFRLTDLPVDWGGAAGAVALAVTGVVGLVVFARRLRAEGWVARRWLRRPRRPMARAVVVGRLVINGTGLAAVAALYVWAVPLVLGLHTFRFVYVIDPTQVTAVEVEVTDFGPRGTARPAPARATLADPAEVAAVVARLGAGGRYPYQRTTHTGRYYSVRFRGRDGILLRESVSVHTSTVNTVGTYDTRYHRAGWPFTGGSAGPYTNPALGQWLEATVAGRLPPEP